MHHAARTEEKLLGRSGAALLAPAEHFAVTGTTAPLAAGEEERARAWGRALAGRVTSGALGR
jgi:hypothetical protein